MSAKASESWPDPSHLKTVTKATSEGHWQSERGSGRRAAYFRAHSVGFWCNHAQTNDFRITHSRLPLPFELICYQRRQAREKPCMQDDLSVANHCRQHALSFTQPCIKAERCVPESLPMPSALKKDNAIGLVMPRCDCFDQKHNQCLCLLRWDANERLFATRVLALDLHLS